MQAHPNYPYQGYHQGYPEYRGQPYAHPTRSRDLPVILPKQRMSWFDRLMMVFGVIVLVLMIVGFWQAGSAGG